MRYKMVGCCCCENAFYIFPFLFQCSGKDVCHALSVLKRTSLQHAIFNQTVKNKQWQQTPCRLNGEFFLKASHQLTHFSNHLELIMKILNAGRRWGRNGEERKDVKVQWQLTDASLHKPSILVSLNSLYGKRQDGWSCTSLILTSLGEIVPAPMLVSGPVPCRF